MDGNTPDPELNLRGQPRGTHRQVEQPTCPLPAARWQQPGFCKPKRSPNPPPLRTPRPEDLAGVSFASQTSFKLKVVALQLGRATPWFLSPPLAGPTGKRLEGEAGEPSGAAEPTKRIFAAVPSRPRCLAPPSASAAARGGDGGGGGGGGGTGAPVQLCFSFLTAAVTPRGSSGFYTSKRTAKAGGNKMIT